MNSLFIRIYGGIIATLVIVALLALLAVDTVNTVRSQAYRETMASGTFLLMASGARRQKPELQDKYMALVSRLMGYDIQIKSTSEFDLSKSQLVRLADGQVIVTADVDEDFADVFVSLNAPQPLADTHQVDFPIITTRIRRVGEQQARATVTLLKDELAFRTEPTLADKMTAVRPLFGYLVSTFPLDQADEAGLDDEQFRRLNAGEAISVVQSGGEGVNIYSLLPDKDNVVVFGPVTRFNVASLHQQVIIAIAGLLIIGIAVYLLVRPLERRLKGLDAAAKHIVRGNLNARVTVHSSDAVGHLGQTFNSMAEHIQHLLSIQKEMIRAVSHELRTPVARIRFGLEMIEEAGSQEQRKKHLTDIDGDIDELDQLIDEILTYARLEDGTPTLKFERIDPDQLLTQIESEMKHIRTGIQVHGIASGLSESKRQVEAEFRYLHRAVQNLVGNGIRYANEQVTMKFTMQHDTCRIDVEDDGPGIPEKDWERVFTPFARLDDSRTRASGGYGLGLSIVQRITYWHGGRALVGRSSLGGAKFSIIWPKRQSLTL